MNRRERREAKRARVDEKITEVLVGIFAAMGALYLFCGCANIILHWMGVA